MAVDVAEEVAVEAGIVAAGAGSVAEGVAIGVTDDLDESVLSAVDTMGVLVETATVVEALELGP